MACSYVFSDDKSFLQDLDFMLEQSDQCPSLLKYQSCSIQLQKQQSDAKSNVSCADLVDLERGGCILQTKIGPIQYGMPPETIKDCLNLGMEVPTFYIIPSKRFDKRLGISTAEFEFPAYFNFFCKKKQITLICTPDTEKAIRTVFQETLLGPIDHPDLALDFYHKFPKSAYPDFHKERSVFSRNPSNLDEKLTIDHLLKFCLFDENNTATIIEGDITIKIIKDSNSFKILENGIYQKSIQDVFTFPSQYYEYIVTKPDDYRAESMKNIKSKRDAAKEQCPTPLLVKQLPEMTVEEKVENWVIGNKYQRGGEKKLSVVLWDQMGGHVESGSAIFQLDIDENKSFTPPDFGVTILGCSHGFDPKGSTSGYIFWINGRGIMVDPPPFASYHMKQMGIPSILICAVIISHCHADHDAGTFHKILDDTRVEIITTRTIMNSFLRKYSAMSNIDIDSLRRLFIFRPVIIGIPLNIYGAYFNFFYAMHTIPSLGFSVKLENKSIYFSSDTFFDPDQLLVYKNQGILSQKRYEHLAFIEFKEDLILHEAGVPPIHTAQSVLGKLPNNIKNRLYLVHTAQKDLKKELGLKIAKTGIENTMILIPSNTNKHLTTIRRLDLLSTIDIFEHLTLKNVRWLLDSVTAEEYFPGQDIIKEGTSGDRFYIIESGLARVYSKQKGQEFERYYQVGDYFGESAVLSSEGKRGASVEAVTNLKVLILEKHDFWFIFGDGLGGQGPIIQKMKQLTAARRSKAVHCLFKNSILSELTPSQKTQLEMIMREHEIEKGTVLWKVGEKPEFAFIIKRGTFAFYDSPEQDLEELDSGAYVGELKAMIENTAISTSIRATRKATIFKIAKKDLISFANKHPGIYMILIDTKYLE
ncbi:unnamed protein product [Paramecium pentaurelia]|uniref:Cyclic nucleotide-binding domain-containing protein n=1 Tax=Paramecium pentaurelia TaxID=43138 RepID=A0A8S1T834_9CILI|nr:unnamed protein product [Paramecium pentaurelia]